MQLRMLMLLAGLAALHHSPAAAAPIEPLGPIPSGSGSGSWSSNLLPRVTMTEAELAATRIDHAADLANNCYIALFTGAVCESAGGVYKISAAWYSGHYGNYAITIESRCGTAVAGWTGKANGAHSGEAGNLVSENDLSSNRGTWVAELVCAPPPTDQPSKAPSNTPSAGPSDAPTNAPSDRPSKAPSAQSPSTTTITTKAASSGVTAAPTEPAATQQVSSSATTAPTTRVPTATQAASSGATAAPTAPAATSSTPTSASSNAAPTTITSASSAVPSSNPDAPTDTDSGPLAGFGCCAVLTAAADGTGPGFQRDVSRAECILGGGAFHPGRQCQDVMPAYCAGPAHAPPDSTGISYEHELGVLGGAMLFSWTVDNAAARLRVRLSGQTTGWVGFGIGEQGNGGMAGADLVQAAVGADGVARVQDGYAKGFEVPTADTAQDWALEAAHQSPEGVTTVELSRLLDTGDPAQDRPFAAAADTRLLFAVGPADADNFGQYHGPTHREFRTVDLFAAPGQSADAPDPVVAMLADPTTGAYSRSYFKPDFAYPAPAGSEQRKDHETTYSNFCVDIAFGGAVSPADHIVGFRPIIDHRNREGLVHHIAIKTRPVSCAEDSSSPETGLFTWVPGVDHFMLPDDVGFPMTQVKSFTLDIHYNHVGNPVPADESRLDSSGIEMIFAPARQHAAGMMTVGDPWVQTEPVELPGHFSEFEYECPGSWTATAWLGQQSQVPTGLTVIGTSLHAHGLGRTMELKLTAGNSSALPTGSQHTIAKSEWFDDDFQSVQPTHATFTPGDTISVNCKYQAPGPDGTSKWGLSTQDEMCMVFVMYYPALLTMCHDPTSGMHFQCQDCGEKLGGRTVISRRLQSEAKLGRVFGSTSSLDLPGPVPNPTVVDVVFYPQELDTCEFNKPCHQYSVTLGECGPALFAPPSAFLASALTPSSWRWSYVDGAKVQLKLFYDVNCAEAELTETFEISVGECSRELAATKGGTMIVDYSSSPSYSSHPDAAACTSANQVHDDTLSHDKAGAAGCADQLDTFFDDGFSCGSIPDYGLQSTCDHPGHGEYIRQHCPVTCGSCVPTALEQDPNPNVTTALTYSTVTNGDDSCTLQIATLRRAELSPSQGEDVVVALHGYPEGGYHMMMYLAEYLVTRYNPASGRTLRVVMPSLRGYNRSTIFADPSHYTIDKLAADVHAVLGSPEVAEVRAAGGSVTLLSHDWGSAVASVVSGLYPTDFDSTVFINGPHIQGWIDELRHNPTQMAAASYMDFFVSPEFIDSCAVAPQLCLDYVLSPAVPADELMYYQDAWSQGCASSGTVCSVVAGALYYTANFQFNTDLAGADTVTEGVSLSAVLPADALPMLTTTKPSLVLWGEADTAFDTEAMLAQFCAHARADLFIERFPGVDHFDSVRHHSVLSKVRSWLEGSREESFGPTDTACSDGGVGGGAGGNALVDPDGTRTRRRRDQLLQCSTEPAPRPTTRDSGEGLTFSTTRPGGGESTTTTQSQVLPSAASPSSPVIETVGTVLASAALLLL